MNVILLINVTFPWNLVVPYPAIQKKCFWIFFWHLLTPESVWLLKGGRLGYEATRFLSSCWSHKSALVCSWPEACVLPPPSAPAELGMSHPQILYHSNSPKPCHSFDFLIPGCWQRMAPERDLLFAVHSLSWRAETCSVLNTAEQQHNFWACWWAHASRASSAYTYMGYFALKNESYNQKATQNSKKTRRTNLVFKPV